MLETTKQEVLSLTTFGQRIAEDETEALNSYFVETHQWRKILSGEIDVIYGPKGSGKSALYSLLRKKRDDLLTRNIYAAPGENIRGALVFSDLVAEPPDFETFGSCTSSPFSARVFERSRSTTRTLAVYIRR